MRWPYVPLRRPPRSGASLRRVGRRARDALSPDHRIVLKAEEQRVESFDALIEPLDLRAGSREERDFHGRLDRGGEPELDVVKAGCLEDELHRVRVSRLDVRRVVVEARGEQ